LGLKHMGFGKGKPLERDGNVLEKIGVKRKKGGHFRTKRGRGPTKKRVIKTFAKARRHPGVGEGGVGGGGVPTPKEMKKK